jgi:ferredoxin
MTLKEDLLRSGASVVGFASVRDVLHSDIAHLNFAVSIGVDKNLNEKTVHLLAALQKKAAGYLRKGGYRHLCIPPDSDRTNGSFISKLYPLFNHKMAATSAGLGWIGRNGLFINHKYGPRLSLATVLTDADLDIGTPVEFSRCGDCRLCLEYCPSGAITGNEWSRYDPFVQLVRLDNCCSHKKNIKKLSGKPNCGLCINICPYGRNGHKREFEYQEQTA